MSPEIPPAAIRQAQFRTVLRGLDRAEVEAFLHQVAGRLEELEGELKTLREASQAPGPSWEGEFDAIGREVTNILQAAREAAEAMRERASADAARWRGEALEEAETNRREAAADAEALRRDAWVTGTTLLDQSAVESRRMREQAERDVLTVMGEAEREAHRLTSAARREAEDLVRNAAMSAEKTTVEAEKRRDDIIEAASRQAAAAQERTRALEQRRDELLEELESVRSTLSKLESSLDEKREHLEYSAEESTSVKVVPPPPREDEPTGDRAWEFGETVRVVPGESRIPRLPTEPAPPVAETVDEDEAKVEELEETPGTAAEVPVAEPVSSDQPESAGTGSDIDSLFAALRSSPADEVAAAAEAPSDEVEPESIAAPDSGPALDFEGHDWIEDRDSRLLPITNRALRGTKKSITELQNIALDQLRTEEKWRPDPKAVAETLGADLISLWAESFAAGHAVAEEMTGTKLKRPATPHSEAVEEVAAALSESLTKALDAAGDGQRERQSAASKVFRVWRSDEAEQRLRELSIRAYQQGVEKSVASAE